MLGRLRSNRKSLSAQRPKSCGMLGYNDTTSNVTSRTSEGKSIMLRILRIKSSVSLIDLKLYIYYIYITSKQHNIYHTTYNKQKKFMYNIVLYITMLQLCNTYIYVHIYTYILNIKHTIFRQLDKLHIYYICTYVYLPKQENLKKYKFKILTFYWYQYFYLFSSVFSFYATLEKVVMFHIDIGLYNLNDNVD